MRPSLSLAGVWLRGTPPHRMGFPCCVKISVYRHAVVITPVARWALIARGTVYSSRLPVPSGCGLPHSVARSASTLVVSRPAQRSLAITACRLAALPKATHLSRRLRRFCFLHHRSDSYRLERPRYRARITLAEDQHLQHGARRVEMWRGGFRLGISVTGPFVCRCLTSFAMAPFPHLAHQTRRAVFPHRAFGQGCTHMLLHTFAHEQLPLRSPELVQPQLLMQVLVRKSVLALSPHFELRTQPLTHPIADVAVDAAVSFVDSADAEIVRPTT
jgi:hypothetical protein